MPMSIDRILAIAGIGIAILGIIIGIGVAIAMDPKGKGELFFSVGCFLCSGLMLCVVIGWWALLTDAVASKRILVVSPLFLLVCISMVEASRWVRGRHEAVQPHESSRQKPSLPFSPSQVPQTTPITVTVKLSTPVLFDFKMSKVAHVASMKVNTKAMEEFATDYNLLIIIRPIDNRVDSRTDTRIQKSEAFTITGEIISINIPLSDLFFKDIGNPQAVSLDRPFPGNVGLDICVIPKRIRPAQILTIMDVTALGGRQLQISPNLPPDWHSQ